MVRHTVREELRSTGLCWRRLVCICGGIGFAFQHQRAGSHTAITCRIGWHSAHAVFTCGPEAFAEQYRSANGFTFTFGGFESELVVRRCLHYVAQWLDVVVIRPPSDARWSQRIDLWFDRVPDRFWNSGTEDRSTINSNGCRISLWRHTLEWNRS